MITPYERVKQTAFNLARKNKIKDFSSDELYRVFKRTKEKVLYMSIMKIAIDEGMTITSLYDQDPHGLEM